MRKCARCNKEKEESEFPNGDWYCRRCDNLNYCNDLPHAKKRKYQDIFRKYDITKREYDAMYKKQKGTCAICKEVPSRIMVDHCHETGKVRGLLCGGCNTAIGIFKDNPDTMKSAIKYIKKSLQ
jgi:hypothetical protein